MHLIGLFDSIKVGRTEALVSYTSEDLLRIRNESGNSLLHVAVEHAQTKPRAKCSSTNPMTISEPLKPLVNPEILGNRLISLIIQLICTFNNTIKN